MREWLVTLTEGTVVIIDAMALLVVAIGTVQAFVSGLRLLLTSTTGHERRDVWLRYARWLVAGLTFQLAADIIETSISADWEAIARVAAIAVIRTFMSYFLEKDFAELRQREEKAR